MTALNLKISSNPASMKNWKRCAIITAIITVVFIVILVTFAVFRPKQAITTVNSVHLEGFELGFNAANLGVDVNATLILNISVTNPNKSGFRAGNGSAVLRYGGRVIGEAVIPDGEIGGKTTVEKVVKLTILVNRLASDRNLYGDVIDDGVLVIETATRVPGKVRVLGFRHRMVMYTTCDAVIDVLGRTVMNSTCKSRTKF